MITLFFSCSHKDEELRNELETHLATLKRQGVIRVWHDRRITAGSDLGKAISEELEEAQIILLLVSARFLRLAPGVCFNSLSITNRCGTIPDMKLREEDLVQRCVERVRELPFVDQAVFREKADVHEQPGDGILQIITPNGAQEFIVEAKRTHLTRAIIDGLIAHGTRYRPAPWILFAPHVGRPLAQYLEEQDANFVDLAGNCRLRIDRLHFAMIEGRPPERRPREGRGIGAPGAQVLFAVLARPDLLNAPVRTLAEAARVAPATAADRVAQLRSEGLVHEADGERRLAEPQRILDLWLRTYGTQVRPKLLIGRYRTQDADPGALERRIEDTLGEDVIWAWGGGAAAQRLTGYYRGPDTVIHLQAPGLDVPKRLRALRANDGLLVLLRAPGPIAFEGAHPHTVNPLLVYTELLFTGDKRAREAAGEIRKKFLGHLP